MPGRPPRVDVWMLAVGHQHVAKPAVRPLFDVELELVQAFEIPDQAALATVDLEPVVVLAARSEPRALDATNRAILEADEGERRVVHVHLRLGLRSRKGPLFD